MRGPLIRAIEGATFVNERYRAYRRWALDVGMLVGPYHYAYPLDLDYADKLQRLLAFPPV